MSRVKQAVAAGLLLVASSVVGIAVNPTAASAQTNDTIVVTSTSNAGDVDPQDGICLTSQDTCTFRAAIETANARGGSDLIHFNIPGSGTKTIDVNGELPVINDTTGSLTIDGYTQSDAAVNTAQSGSNAIIRIQLQGDESYGLKITSAENTVRGLAISGFDSNIQLHYDQADGNTISGNFIGPDASGNGVIGSTNGIQLWLGPDQNIIGGPNLADRNVISGNGRRGLLVEQGGTSQNTIQNNVVGLNPSLTDRLNQGTGIDLQWGTWGNLVGGLNPGEGNLFSGNQISTDGNWGGIDMSHQAAGNLILGNFIGTLGDGNSGTSYSANTHGILMKDDAKHNFIADNVIVNSQYDGVKQRHNFNGPSIYVDNRIGVGAAGAALPNGRSGIRLNGHDDLFHGNIVANNSENGIIIIDETFNDSNTNHPPEQTLRNVVRYGTYYNNGGPQVDIAPAGVTPNDPGDVDDGPNRLLNTAVFTGLGQGEVYGTACAGCEVQIYLSGPVRSDGTVDIDSSSSRTAAGYMASARADGAGKFSLADARLLVDKKIWGLVIDQEGNTSEWTAGGVIVPSTPYGIEGNPASALTPEPRPATPGLPPAYVSQLPGAFDCSHAAGRLTWTDVDAVEYYVFSTTNGAERYLGPKTATSSAVPDADSYRVTQWKYGRAITATCEFSGSAEFSCSVSGDLLSWTDAGASQYYLFATTGGVDRYLGAQSGTSLTVQPADSYRITHWLGGGPTRATCDGVGGDVFSCSVSGGQLSWDDDGASEYYVFATSAGVDRYLGGHSGTSLSVASADSFRVTYWVGGSPTRASCS